MSQNTKTLWLVLMMVWVAGSAAAQTLDDAARTGVVNALAENLVEGYIYEEKGKEVAGRCPASPRSR